MKDVDKKKKASVRKAPPNTGGNLQNPTMSKQVTDAVDGRVAKVLNYPESVIKTLSEKFLPIPRRCNYRPLEI